MHSIILGLCCVAVALVGVAPPESLLSAKVDGGIVFTTSDTSRAAANGIKLWLQADNGVPELVYVSRGAYEDGNALAQAYWSGQELAVIMGTPADVEMYWRFQRNTDSGVWQIVAKADVDVVGMAKRFEFTSTRKFAAVKANVRAFHYEVLDEPRAGHPLFKRVLRDGQEYFGGIYFPGEVRPTEPKPPEKSPQDVIQPYPELPVAPLPELPRSPWRTVQAVLPTETSPPVAWWAVIAAMAVGGWGYWVHRGRGKTRAR